MVEGSQTVEEEIIRTQIRQLEVTIGRLKRLKNSLPEGSDRDRLFEEISALDSIAHDMLQALDLLA